VALVRNVLNYSFQAGVLRRRVTIQSLIEAKDSAGGLVQTWVNFAINVPAAIDWLSGRELFAAQQVESEVTASISIRWRPGVLETMRILHTRSSPDVGMDIFNIESLIPDATGREYIEMLCSLRKAEGFRADV
jgi:SPP1 family predicted phage head-tail adaptor